MCPLGNLLILQLSMLLFTLVIPYILNYTMHKSDPLLSKGTTFMAHCADNMQWALATTTDKAKVPVNHKTYKDDPLEQQVEVV